MDSGRKALQLGSRNHAPYRVALPNVVVSFPSAIRKGRWRCRALGRVKVRFLFVVSLFPLLSLAQTNTGFSGFTQSFNPATTNILFTTTNARGYFLAGEPIGLATIDNSPLNVFAWYGGLVYSGSATILFLPPGHYFVEAPGDRNEFAVLPADWSTLPQVGWDSDYFPYPNITNLWAFLQLGWVRANASWDVIQAASSNSWDWT